MSGWRLNHCMGAWVHGFPMLMKCNGDETQLNEEQAEDMLRLTMVPMSVTPTRWPSERTVSKTHISWIHCQATYQAQKHSSCSPIVVPVCHVEGHV